jgi:hypothetical protein
MGVLFYTLECVFHPSMYVDEVCIYFEIGLRFLQFMDIVTGWLCLL